MPYLVVVEVLLTPFPPPPIDELVNEVCVKLDDPFAIRSFMPPKMSGIPPPRILPKGERLLKEPKPPPSKLNGDKAPENKKQYVSFVKFNWILKWYLSIHYETTLTMNITKWI